MVAAGGPTKSPLWMQIHADVSNVPITLTAVPDGPALGSAILGAVAAGLFPSVQSAAEQMVHVRVRIEPDPAMHEAYKFYVDQYINTYPPLQAADPRDGPAQRGASVIFPATRLTLSGERFTVHYRLVAGGEAEARAIARGICLEQTVEVSDELLADDDIRGQVVGRIEALEARGQAATTPPSATPLRPRPAS